tara:strand:+ start:1384 stop:1626 length:243 start_codon:yes stop_codon:yes gene_type:complete
MSNNIVWLTREDSCVVCGWLTYTSVDGVSHVCNNLPCINDFRSLEWRQESIATYDCWVKYADMDAHLDFALEDAYALEDA